MMHIFTFSFQNYATAERPRCMLREDFYPYHNRPQQQQQQHRRYRKFDYIRDHDFDDETNWNWNMNHNQQTSKWNGSSSVTSGKSNKGRNERSSGGFQSFFRWFKKDDKNRNLKDIRYPRELTSSNDTLDYDDHPRHPPVQYRKKLRGYEHSPSPPPPTSPRKSYGFSQSSSCDSIFSTASSFAFVPPIKYLLNKNQRQVRDKLLNKFKCLFCN